MVLRHTCILPSRSHVKTRTFVGQTLCLVLAPSLFTGCILGAAVGAMTAVTEVGVLAEGAIPNQDEPEIVIVKEETRVYSGPGEEYPQITRLSQGAEIKVLKQDGDWIECCCDECRNGWIHCSCVSDM